MAGRDLLANHPHIRECLEIMSKAGERFTKDCDASQPQDATARIVIFFNALIRLWIDIEKAKNVGAGMEAIVAGRKARRTITRELNAIWPKRPIGLAESRAIAVGIAYRDGIRFAISGEQDSRMEAALQAAAIREGLRSEDAVGTVRKSLSRLRKQMRGQALFHLDRRSLRVKAFDAETVMFADLPGRAGRPRKRPL